MRAVRASTAWGGAPAFWAASPQKREKSSPSSARSRRDTGPYSSTPGSTERSQGVSTARSPALTCSAISRRASMSSRSARPRLSTSRWRLLPPPVYWVCISWQ